MTAGLVRIAAATAAILIGAVSPLDAQHGRGFWLSGGLGYGSLGCPACDGRDGGVSGGFSLGGTLGPRLLLSGSTAGWTKSEGVVRITVAVIDARLRFYPSLTAGLFVTGGLGLGTLHVGADGISESETGLGALLGLGYDVPMGANVSVTPFWNGFTVRTSNSRANVVQVGLGVTVH